MGKQIKERIKKVTIHYLGYRQPSQGCVGTSCAEYEYHVRIRGESRT